MTEEDKAFWKSRILVPERIEAGKDFYYSWPMLFIGRTNKGDGVFAKVDIPALTFIPYIGIVFPENQYPTFFTQFITDNLQNNQYIVSTNWDEVPIHIDGSPQWFPWNRIGCKGLAIGAKINEPTETEEANCIFADSRTWNVPLNGLFFIVTTKQISKGKELLVCYGSQYHRNYNVNSLCQNIELKQKWYNSFEKFSNNHDNEIRLLTLYDMFPTIYGEKKKVFPPLPPLPSVSFIPHQQQSRVLPPQFPKPLKFARRRRK